MPKGHEFEFIPLFQFFLQYDGGRLKPGYYFPIEQTDLGQRELRRPLGNEKDLVAISKNPNIVGVNYYTVAAMQEKLS